MNLQASTVSAYRKLIVPKGGLDHYYPFPRGLGFRV